MTTDDYLRSVGLDWGWFETWAKARGLMADSRTGLVKAVQVFVGVTPDGIVGPMTYKAVLAMPGDHNQMQTTPPVTIEKGPALTGYSRGRHPMITQHVLHESVDASVFSTLSTLTKRALGVHFLVDRLGRVTQHLDLKLAGAHAEGFGRPSQHNEVSVAYEIVNRYYGTDAAIEQVKERYPEEYRDALVIETLWADRAWSKTTQSFKNQERRYICPTLKQLEALWQIIIWVSTQPGVTAPLLFPASVAQPGGEVLFSWGPYSGHEGARGIMAHHRWDHADGLFPEHYCLCRSLGLLPQEAYTVTIENAQAKERHTVVQPRVMR